MLEAYPKDIEFEGTPTGEFWDLLSTKIIKHCRELNYWEEERGEEGGIQVSIPIISR